MNRGEFDGAGTPPEGGNGGLSRLGDIVRRHDRDRFATALFAPSDRREALFALYAFNHEVARTREVVSETLLGQVRLQWWREAVDEIYTGTAPRRHEVVAGLAEVVRTAGLERSYFDRLIDGRERDLSPDPPDTLTDLLAYVDATSGMLIALAMQALGVPDPRWHAVGRQVGLAYGLVGLLRAVPFHARAQRLYLPRRLLDKHGVTVRNLFDLKPESGLSDAVATLAGEAREILKQARSRGAAMPRVALPALLVAVLAERQLRVLAHAKYDVFHPDLTRRDAWALPHLWWRSWRGRY
jgi:phytoene synthase